MSNKPQTHHIITTVCSSADCAEGTGYNRLTKACDTCPIGQIRTPNISDYCYFCPTGQTTAFAGSKTCLIFQGEIWKLALHIELPLDVTKSV